MVEYDFLPAFKGLKRSDIDVSHVVKRIYRAEVIGEGCDKCQWGIL